MKHYIRRFLILFQCICLFRTTNTFSCESAQCREALNKATKASGASMWRTDPIGSLRLYSNLFDLSKLKNDQIRIKKLPKCKKHIKTKYFTTFKKYINFVESRSKIRGVKKSIISDNGFYHNVTFSPPYKLSAKYLNTMQYFLDGGSIATSFGECLVYDIQLNTTGKQLPKFSAKFIEMIKDLYKAAYMNQKHQKRIFEKFRYYFGDYYFGRVQIGMQFSYTKSLPGNSRTRIKRREIKSCNHRKLAKSIKTRVTKKYQKVKCTWKGKSSNGESTYRVNGGSFKEMKKMRNDEITGNPVRYTLIPITELLTDKLFKRNNIKVDDEIIRSAAINQWLTPVYHDKLKDYTVKNECPVGYKLYGNWERHNCQDWGEWKCNAKCGKGFWKSRQRSCYGCLGRTWERKKEECYAGPPCEGNEMRGSLQTYFMMDGL
ncbi:uncharacterized protein [Clytia hemisphaerica]|uniref:Cnidarian restricted protein n=1 Tax=Clytia hemisphaerica TaxID=252671 RepID=A0A7M5U6A6_9CNID